MQRKSGVPAPLRVCLPCFRKRSERLFRLVGRFAIVTALTISVLVLPTPEGLSPQGHRALAALVFTGSLLALQPVSLPIAGLMVPVVQVILGVANSTQAFETFSRPVIFLVLGSLFLAEALRKHGLTRRLALASIASSNGDTKKLLLGIMGIAALLSMWVENTATAAVLIPVALTISREVPNPKKSRELLVLLVLGISYSASLGGMVTIMGSASNAVASGFLADIQVWTFIDWMRYGLTAFILIFPITYWILPRLLPATVQKLDMSTVTQELEKIGSMKSAEREILTTMAAAIFFWITGSFIETTLDLPPTTLSPAIIAVAAISYLSLRGIFTWEDVKGVSWGFLFIIGAGLSLGETLGRTGVTAWLGNLMRPIVAGSPISYALLLLVFLSALLTNVMNNATVAAVFVPILISIAQVDPSFKAVQLALPVALATTFGYSLSSASGRMALVASTGIVDRKDMIWCGLILTFISSVILAVYFYLLIMLNLI
jgi:sodium-dependent dicarboxylate transporter 2/3/5